MPFTLSDKELETVNAALEVLEEGYEEGDYPTFIDACKANDPRALALFQLRERIAFTESKPDELIECDWCVVNLVHRHGFTYDGAHICNRCSPYAWAAVVHPETYGANKAIAIRRARS